MDEVSVFKTWDEPLADMAVGLLHEEGITAHKITSVPRSVYPFTLDGLAEIEIRVPEKDRARASEIITVRFSEGNTMEPDDFE